MDVGSVVYAFLQGGKPRQLEFEDVQSAVDKACEHLEGEEAMIFQIRQGERVLYSGLQIIEMYPDWLEWRDGKGNHPAMVPTLRSELWQ